MTNPFRSFPLTGDDNTAGTASAEVLAEESDLDPPARLDVPVRFEAADPGPGIEPGPAPHDLPGTQAADSPFDLAFGTGEEVAEVDDGWPGEDPGHADGAPADLSGIEFREFHVYEGEGVVNSTMGDDVEDLENYAVEIRDHRGCNVATKRVIETG